MGMVVTEYVDLPVLLAAAAGATLLVFWLMATRFGLAMRALHDDELVSTLMGVPARAVQVASFAIGAGLAGLAGALYAHHFSFVEAQYVSPLLSIYVLLFVLIGGTQTAWGPLVGATFSPIRNRTQKPDDPDGLGHFFMAMDPAAFRAPGEFEDDLDAVIDVLHATPATDPSKPVLVAGEPEEAERLRRLEHGIPIPPALDQHIRAICQRSGAPYLLS